MKIIANKVIFSTGTELFASCGVIGLGPDLEVSEGWDSGFYNPSDYYSPEDRTLTGKERIELADYMINQWGKFKKEAENGE